MKIRSDGRFAFTWFTKYITLPCPLEVWRGFYVLVGDDQNAADLMQQLHTVICLVPSRRIAVKEHQLPIA